MSNTARDGTERLATPAALRRHATRLRAIGAEHGITHLRVAGPGRLVGHVDDDRDMFDVAEFEVVAEELLGAEIDLFSDGVLTKPNVSPDLFTATPL